jgi:hypothetical protein
MELMSNTHAQQYRLFKKYDHCTKYQYICQCIMVSVTLWKGLKYIESNFMCKFYSMLQAIQALILVIPIRLPHCAGLLDNHIS